MDGRLASEEWIKIGSGGLGNAAKKYTARSKGGTTKSDRVKHWSGLVIRFIARVDIDALAANNAAADTWLPTTSETSQVAQASRFIWSSCRLPSSSRLTEIVQVGKVYDVEDNGSWTLSDKELQSLIDLSISSSVSCQRPSI